MHCALLLPQAAPGLVLVISEGWRGSLGPARPRPRVIPVAARVPQIHRTDPPCKLEVTMPASGTARGLTELSHTTCSAWNTGSVIERTAPLCGALLAR